MPPTVSTVAPASIHRETRMHPSAATLPLEGSKRPALAAHSERGLTLVEVMIAAAILSILVVYLFSTVTTQQRTYAVIDQVTEAQQNLRLVADMVEREVRVAGYLVPPAAAACAADFQDRPDRLYISAADRVQPVNQLASSGESGAIKDSVYVGVDEGDLGLGTLGTTETFDLERLWMDVAVDGKDFVEGEGIILVDLNDDSSVVACGTITNLAASAPLNGPASVTVDFETTQLSVTSASEIVAVAAHVYRVEPEGAGANPNVSQLFRNDDLMASDVEDLQVVFYFDDDDDRVVDGGELYGDDAAPTYPPPATVDYERLVEVRLNLVTVTRDDDPSGRFTQMRGQATANRDPNTVPGVDQRRRRVHSTTVRLRNLG